MLAPKEYLPVGSVVLLKGGKRKVMIIGIAQSCPNGEGKTVEYDYIGVVYPVGFVDRNSVVGFQQEAINDVAFRGYENPEREDFVRYMEAALEQQKKENAPAKEQ